MNKGLALRALKAAQYFGIGYFGFYDWVDKNKNTIQKYLDGRISLSLLNMSSS